MASKLIVLRKLETWFITAHACLRQFPKAERFTLANRIENGTIECVDLIFLANFDRAQRAQHLLSARITVERLQFMIRASHTLNLMDGKHYALLSEGLTEIAKMLAGWAKSDKGGGAT